MIMAPLELLILIGLAVLITKWWKQRAANPSTRELWSPNLKSFLFYFGSGVLGASLVLLIGAVIWGYRSSDFQQGNRLAVSSVMTVPTPAASSLTFPVQVELDTQSVPQEPPAPAHPIGMRTIMLVPTVGLLVIGLTLCFGVAFGYVLRRNRLSQNQLGRSGAAPSHSNRGTGGRMFARFMVVTAVILGGYFLVGTSSVTVHSGVAETSSSPDGHETFVQHAIESETSNSQSVRPAWFTIAIIGVIVLVSLSLIPRNRVTLSSETPIPALPASEPKGLGLAWLIVPIAGLLWVGVQATDLYQPTGGPKESRELAELPQRQERMLKIAKEFVDSDSANPDSGHQWIRQAVEGKLEANRLVLVSGQFSSIQEAENELIPIISGLVQRDFHKVHPWQGPWNVPSAQVRERVIENQYIERNPRTIGNFTGDLFRSYMLVNLTPEILTTFESGWKSKIVERRLAGLSVIIGWFIFHLLIGLVYFQTEPESSGKRRWGALVAATLASLSLTRLAIYGFTQIPVYFP